MTETNKIEFIDGFYINRDEVLDDVFSDMEKKGSREVNLHLNNLERLSKFFTLRTIKEYLESTNQDKENMSNIDYAFYDLNICDKEMKEIRCIIDNYCHKDDKTSKTPLDCDYDGSYKRIDNGNILLSDGYISKQEIYDYFRERRITIVSATAYINLIRRLKNNNITLEDLRSDRDIPGLPNGKRMVVIRELAMEFGRNINSPKSMNDYLRKQREEILKLQKEMEAANKEMEVAKEEMKAAKKKMEEAKKEMEAAKEKVKAATENRNGIISKMEGYDEEI